MLTITTNKNGAETVVLLDGRLDVNSAMEADRTLMESAEQAEQLVLDCKDLSYISSAGLRTIKRLRTKMKGKGGKLVLRNVRPVIMEIFETTGFVAILTFEK